jgi:putative transposase
MKRQPGLEWLKEIDSQLLQQALADCKRAFTNFFERRARFPQFKKKKTGPHSFRIPQRVKVESGKVYCPKIGWIKIRQSQRVDLPLKSATFKQNAQGDWYISLVAEFDLPERERLPVNEETAVGLDLGLRSFAASSAGEKTDNPRFFRASERKLRRVQRTFSRRKKGSRNRGKAAQRVARIHDQIKNKRADFTHKFTITLIENNATICCESLNIRGFARTKLAKSFSDAAHGEVRRQLEYKAR